jgi:carbonic anhydrase
MTVFRKLRQALRAKTEISVNAHHSTAIAIVGHHDCAGNPVSKDEHLAQIREAVAYARDWGFPVKVIGLYVNDRWQVEEVTSSR